MVNHFIASTVAYVHYTHKGTYTNDKKNTWLAIPWIHKIPFNFTKFHSTSEHIYKPVFYIFWTSNMVGVCLIPSYYIVKVFIASDARITITVLQMNLATVRCSTILPKFILSWNNYCSFRDTSTVKLSYPSV